MTKKQRALIFAYQSLFAEYEAIKRSRENTAIKDCRLKLYRERMTDLQAVIRDYVKTKIDFAKF